MAASGLELLLLGSVGWITKANLGTHSLDFNMPRSLGLV